MCFDDPVEVEDAAEADAEGARRKLIDDRLEPHRRFAETFRAELQAATRERKLRDIARAEAIGVAMPARR